MHGLITFARKVSSYVFVLAVSTFYRDFYWILEMLDDVLTFSFLIILTLKVPLLSECNHFKQYFDFAGTIFNQKNDARRVLIRPSLR
jgi:hypothetical protein